MPHQKEIPSPLCALSPVSGERGRVRENFEYGGIGIKWGNLFF
jgi:hypothetical protein